MKENIKEETLRLEEEFLTMKGGDDIVNEISFAKAESKTEYSRVIKEFLATLKR